ncbi:MAG: hypothetical protein WBM62_04820 [Crocosphaera sp.]
MERKQLANKWRNFRCRIQIRDNLPEVHLIDYLQSDSRKNDLVLKAMRGFWLPLAIEETNLYSSNDVIKAYLGAIEQLTSHLLYLQQLLRVNYDVEIKPLSLVSVTDEDRNVSKEDLFNEQEEEWDNEPDDSLDCERGNFGF